MKKSKMWILLAVILVILAGVFFATQNTPQKKNMRILSNLLEDFSDTISEKTQAKLVESKGVYGKLNGNGNGIDYFGAVLLNKADVADLDALLVLLEEDFEIVGVLEQKSQKVESNHLQHRSLSYKTPIAEDSQYLTVYFYTHHPDSDLRDPAGH